MSLDEHPEFRLALTAAKPYESLRAAAVTKVAGGAERERLLEELQSLRAETGSEEVEDAVLDVMDELCGWCSQHRRI